METWPFAVSRHARSSIEFAPATIPTTSDDTFNPGGLLHELCGRLGHAAFVAGAVMMVSNSIGVNRPGAVCRRRR